MSRYYDLGSSAWHDLSVDKKELRKKVASLRRALMYVHKDGDETDDRDAAIHNILNGRRRLDIVELDTDSLVDVPCDRCGKIKWKTLKGRELRRATEHNWLSTEDFQDVSPRSPPAAAAPDRARPCSLAAALDPSARSRPVCIRTPSHAQPSPWCQ